MTRRATHSIPAFDGHASRRHESVSIRRLNARGAFEALRHRRRLAGIQSIVHFAGFPRSGHSLIGSIIDAHPNARIAHELDAIGLLEAGLPLSRIAALMDHASRVFTRHGRYWNGYCYYVEGASHHRGDTLSVIGDKKGDMAVKRIQARPDLLEQLNRDTRWRKPWICVTRNPFDNIATMSLRAGRAYDALRTRTPEPAAFAAALRQSQADGHIADTVSDEQIDIYAALCETVERIRSHTAETDWHTLCHSALAAAPHGVLSRLMAFLGLPIDPDHIARSAALIHTRPSATRELVAWPAAARERVAGLIERYPFLAHYRDERGHAVD
ncbi:hypothetical protein [Salinisphaera japonica]|uniref:Sulfotransferase n=1 Tax=Salinisphaera japonica YTM-1 TaxID=1209778 RepID=A0A423PJA6_9GAMM|nr:hypothetical protein [Salinisphaera japonica]ROO25684.1 hypothetical protein SAJA_12865 [Salinisphaera japonica YTM-1]